jgi:hypothetical protein
MKALRTLKLPVLLLVLTSCARSCTESALSDVVLTDPGLLLLEMRMEKDLSESSGGNVTVWVRDKNEQALTLKEGDIQVEGQGLSVKRNLANLPYYYLASGYVDFEEGHDYSFTVILGNGERYSSILPIPDGNLREFSVPQYHRADQPLTLSWNPLNSAYDARLEWQLEVKTDSATHIETGSEKITPGTQRKTFPADFFDLGEGELISMECILSTEIRGNVHPDFRSDSQLKGIFRWRKRIAFRSKSS